MEMKYVVVSSEEQGEQLFIFPKNINHDSFAEVLSNIRFYKNGNLRDWKRIYREPISAGFTDGVKCYGKSESLNLNSRPEDTEILKAGGTK
jgi:hypothetical protein